MEGFTITMTCLCIIHVHIVKGVRRLSVNWFLSPFSQLPIESDEGSSAEEEENEDDPT